MYTNLFFHLCFSFFFFSCMFILVTDPQAKSKYRLLFFFLVRRTYFYLAAVSKIFEYAIVVVCTDLWDKELHRHVGDGYNGDIREPTRCNGSTLVWNGRDVGSSPTLGTILPIFITTTTLVPWQGSCTSYTLYGCWTYPVYAYVKPLPVGI